MNDSRFHLYSSLFLDFGAFLIRMAVSTVLQKDSVNLTTYSQNS